ncbi:MAG: hypothetical protein EXR94_07225 [Gemmatimonadetes bacterium]|nr:hypothetical protein [Gemmatimonadota bacterium]
MTDPVRTNGASGTLGGLALVVGGGYLVLSQVTVTTNYWSVYGYNAFGLSLIPLLIGIGILFFSGKSAAGWFLALGGMLIILVGVIANLRLFFQPTSLLNTLMMLGALAAGLGLVARSLRSQ